MLQWKGNAPARGRPEANGGDMKRRHAFGIAAMALMLVVALFTAGCGDKTAELSEAVTGIWRVEKSGGTDLTSLEDAGLAVFYMFDDDGTFTMRALAMGSTADRTGSWEVKDGQVVVSVPEMKEQAAEVGSSGIKLTGPAIEETAVTVEEGTLKVEISSKEVEAKEVTQEEYDEIVKASEAKGPQEIALNQQVDNEGCSFTVTSLDFMEEIYPDDTSGYYRYYEDEAGSSYLVARVSATNTHNEYISLHWATDAYFTLDGNKYEAQIVVIDGSSMSQSISIDPQQTANLYIFASIPDSMKDAKSVDLSWTLPKSGSLLNKYFNSSNDSTTYTLAK